MTWGFIWLMFILKIPILGLLWLVWWAISQDTESATDEDGGTKRPNEHSPQAGPRSPRRGPHGEPPLPSPPRVRPVVARARETDPHHD